MFTELYTTSTPNKKYSTKISVRCLALAININSIMEFLHHAHKEGKKFLNPVPTKVATGGNILSLTWKYYTNKAETIPKHALGPFLTDVSFYETTPASGLRITWIGHSSLLIEIDNKRILTDPVWSERASFSSWIGPKRFFAAPLQLSQLPPLDAIIISHDHYDHLDRAVIQQLANTTVPFYCSLKVGQYLEQWGVHKSRITEMDWIEDASIGDNCILTATPARHFSGRGLHNRFQTLWSSFVIKTTSHNIFYGADSGGFPVLNILGIHTVHSILPCLKLLPTTRTGQTYTWGRRMLLRHILH